MVRRYKPGILPMLILLALYIGGLFAAHVTIASLVGRDIADFAILVVFFGTLVLLAVR